uniref:ATP synthase F0 subunit 6 n=1 Tax=Haplodiplatys aotouensis TaxID=2962943 RepID=UPI00211536AA|nr:ATP synthase F0 subunit 6 [Haplodiplatys aotouensis]UTI38881.1 ATP synthase F0 subunit 6 [Haplodiplatys aotouensis]UTI38894.1 ATP synthase F0 subunit 6 [Haplodiplatys aotouensis]
MMSNLFSVFDPASGIFGLSLNWLSVFIGLMIIPLIYWFFPSRMNFLWGSVLLSLHKEFKVLLGSNSQGGSTLIFLSLFSYILFNNFYGLFPYVFTCSSHLVMTLSLSLPLWLSFMLYGWINHTEHMFVHLVPQGTPGVLMFFMVFIETVSNLIRPGTLAVRLMANMVAGHLLMTLLGGTGSILGVFMLNVLVIIQVMLLLLELAVSVIQSYVFVVLSTLYSSEVN